jgi:hypothetical protein
MSISQTRFVEKIQKSRKTCSNKNGKRVENFKLYYFLNRFKKLSSNSNLNSIQLNKIRGAFAKIDKKEFFWI